MYEVWENKDSHKMSTGKSPFQLVYGIEAFFPTKLAFAVMKFLQELYEEAYNFSRRINQIIEIIKIDMKFITNFDGIKTK